MKVLMISNQKGGVGKTTTTLELCSILGEKYRVLGIDLDAQRNFSMYADAKLEDQPTVEDVLSARVLIENAVQRVDNFDILIASKKLSEAAKIFGEPDDIFLLQDVLSQTKGYDLVLIDNAPARSPLLYMSYIASDYIIPVTECDDGALEGLHEIQTDIERFRRRNQTKIQVLGILMTKSERTVMHQLAYESLAEIGQSLSCTPFQTRIRKSIVVSEAKTARQPIHGYQPKNLAARDYMALSEEIMARIKDRQEEGGDGQ